MNKYLSKEELKNIDGGSSITGSLITAFIEGVKAIRSLGRSLGSSIRRLKEKKLCTIS